MLSLLKSVPDSGEDSPVFSVPEVIREHDSRLIHVERQMEAAARERQAMKHEITTLGDQVSSLEKTMTKIHSKTDAKIDLLGKRIGDLRDIVHGMGNKVLLAVGGLIVVVSGIDSLLR